LNDQQAAQEGRATVSIDSDYSIRDEKGRFVKGKSGNPKGRPRQKECNHLDVVAAMHAALMKLVTVRRDGKVVRTNKFDLLIEQIVNDTIQTKNPHHRLAGFKVLKPLIDAMPSPFVIQELDWSDAEEELFELLKAAEDNVFGDMPATEKADSNKPKS
jgi:hypothetical protein